MPPIIAPEKAGTTPVGQQQPAQPKKPQATQAGGKKAKDGQQGGKVWTGNGSAQATQLKTTVSPSDIRALESQFPKQFKWVPLFIASVVKADSVLGRKFESLSTSDDQIDAYRKSVSAELSGSDKEALNKANENSNYPFAVHVCSGLAMAGMIRPITVKVILPDTDKSDLSFLHAMRKVTALGSIDPSQLENEGARS